MDIKKSAEKFAVLNSFLGNSPLFIRAAEYELINNNPEAALKILEKGITHFPEYPTAYILYGRTLFKLGDKENAAEILKEGAELINSVETFEEYIRQLENEEEENKKAAAKSAEKKAPEERGIPQDLAEFTDDLKELLSDEPRKPAIEKSKGGSASKPGAKIVSETMAKIHLQQENYPEAISIYKALIEKTPSRKSEFTAKIEEIKIKQKEKKSN